MAPRGTATRTALIESAERLFAERGIETVSLRDVSAAAGQRNHSAAQYHFDDRAGLVAAVISHRMTVVNARRLALLGPLLDGMPATDDHDARRSLVAAFVEPLAGVVEETDGWYGRFLARARFDRLAREVMGNLPVLVSYQRTMDALAAGLDLPDPLRRLRLEQLNTHLIGTLAAWEWHRDQREPHPPMAALQADLIATGTALLEAPSDDADPHAADPRLTAHRPLTTGAHP